MWPVPSLLPIPEIRSEAFWSIMRERENLSVNILRHDSHIITDLCCLADIQRDIPVAGTLKLSLSLMMDQKASCLISEICRREGAGYILEPSVLHL